MLDDTSKNKWKWKPYITHKRNRSDNSFVKLPSKSIHSLSVNLDELAPVEKSELDETDEYVDPKSFMKASIRNMSEQIKSLKLTIERLKEDKGWSEDLMA